MARIKYKTEDGWAYADEAGGGGSAASTWDEITGKPSTFPPSSHTHAQADVTGLASALSGKQNTISDLEAIRSGAAAGATALQSYTETDPTVPDWAEQPSKPTYTAAEVGALPDSTVIPTVPTAEINANTAARHSHSNKAVLDGITTEKVTAWDGYESRISSLESALTGVDEQADSLRGTVGV